MTVTGDVRYAVRVLARSPIFTATAICSLAIGIAASASIFSLADALLLRPRPGIATPDTLVDVGRSSGGGLDNYGYPLFTLFRDQSTLLEGLAATQFTPHVVALGDAAASERVFATLVSGNYFSVVGTRPATGRFFLPEEDRTPGSHPVAVLAHDFWTRRFGSDPAIVGTTIRLNNLAYTVVGIAEPGFTGTTFVGSDLWVPMAMDAHIRAAERSLLDQHEIVWMTSIGRLKPGVTVEQAREELGAIMRHYLTSRNDPRAERWRVTVSPSSRVPAGIAAPVIGFVGVLGMLTGLVLLIACTNVAGMLLARALERRREIATRLAVGASRRHIVRQLLIEGLALAALAGACSLPLAYGLVRALSSFQPSLPIPIALELQIDPRVMLFAFAIAACAALVFALLPAVQATRFDVTPALHGHAATADGRRAWLRQGLVAAQVAMALLLLVIAGLFVRSLQEAAATDIGVDVRGVDTIQIDTRIGGYRTDAEGLAVVAALAEQFRRVPGVTAVGASRMVPLMGGGLGLGILRAPGYTGPDGSDRVEADWDAVAPGYFEALELDIVSGRPFDDRDRASALRVAIINATMAQTLWPGQDPIGRQLLQGAPDGTAEPLEVVGVARNAKYRMVGEAPRNFIYVPIAQQFMSDVTFYVRRAGEAPRLAELRRAVAAYDSNLPVIHAQTLEEAAAIGLLPQRLAAWIAGSVGAVGLLLSGLGLFGLTAFVVARRSREIAVRIALGATRDAVLSLVLRQAARVAVIGAAAGLLLGMAASTLLSSLLIGLGAFDALAFGGAALLLTLVLLAAAWAPARRAARIDPMRTLRAE